MIDVLMYLMFYFFGIFVGWVIFKRKELPYVEAHPFPYVEYKGKYYAVLHVDTNRVWVDDEKGELLKSLDGRVNVATEYKDRWVGSVENDFGVTYLTHWNF